MEVDAMMLWNVILTLVVAPAFWAFRSLLSEVKRIDILVHKTREESATKYELREDMRSVMDALNRVQDKLDKVLSRE